MVLVRVLLGTIGALLKAFTGAFLFLFRSPVLLVLAVVVLGALVFAFCSACGFAKLRGED